jgi:hypothetical protein
MLVASRRLAAAPPPGLLVRPPGRVILGPYSGLVDRAVTPLPTRRALPAPRASPPQPAFASPPPPRLAFTRSPDPRAHTRPLILLCGWLGCRPRDLDKYGAAWRGLGCDTLAFSPGLGPLLWPPLAEAGSAALEGAALDALAAPARTNASIIAHVFSNGGFYAAGGVLGRGEGGGGEGGGRGLALPTRLAGLVFDSCPARLDPDLAARGVTAAFLGEAAEAGTGTRRRAALVRALTPVLGGLLASPASPLGARVEGAWAAWARLGAALPPGLPRLFLYSDADKLIPASEVEAFAGRVMGWAGEGAGTVAAATTPSPVRLVRFPGSPHCEHLRSDPAGYKREMAGVLDRAGAFQAAAAAAAA